MKTLDNYIVTDKRGWEVIARKCKTWKRQGMTDMTIAIREILKVGGLIGVKPQPGNVVVGHMVNDEVGARGDVWSTGTVAFQNGSLIWTSSGSKYRLLRPLLTIKGE